LVNLFAIIKPKKNEPIIEIKKLLLIQNLKKVPKKAAIRTNIKLAKDIY